MQRNISRDRRILVTGSTGFVGAHLIQRLRNANNNVFGVSRHKKTGSVKLDVLHKSSLESFIKKYSINVIVHLAGESVVEKGQSQPYDTFTTNILSTLNILELAHKHNISKIILASTSHVYGKNKVPYFEKYTPRPSRPYETSKACTDLIAQSYADAFQLPVIIARFVNIYGPGDMNFSRIIPKTIESIIHKNNPKMWGGTAVRDYLYIDDAVEAYCDLLQLNVSKISGSRIFNIGSGSLISVRELIEKLIDISGENVKIEKIINRRDQEIPLQYVSFAKAIKYLDWRPSIGIDDGLARTFAWYKKYFDGKIHEKK